MKKGKICVILLVASCMLTGCIDHMPELTQEESELIAEYAGDVLLKYSPNYHYRIIDLNEITEEEQIPEIETEPESEEMSEEISEEEMKEQTRQETQAVEETENNTLDTAFDDIVETDFAELIGLEGFSVFYEDYEIVDAYPVNQAAFQVAASKGKKLLVVHFMITNEMGENAECDLFSCNPVMMINADGQSAKIMNTLLSNDITSFIGEMEKGSSKDVVALFDIEEEAETITLEVGEKSYYIE